MKQGPGSIILYDAAVKKPGDDIDIESLRFRLVAYSRGAPHGRSAPRGALRFSHFFNEGSGELEF